VAVIVIHTNWMLLASMVGVGIAWAGILSMPYAIVAAILPPERVRIYMGIFNFFIVVPGLSRHCSSAGWCCTLCRTTAFWRCRLVTFAY
jgi:MFS family permease